MSLYALRVVGTDKLLGVDYTNCNGEFCESVTFEFNLECPTIPVWTTTDKEHAVFVTNNRDTAWYNAGYYTPEFPKRIKELDLVVVELILQKSLLFINSEEGVVTFVEKS